MAHQVTYGELEAMSLADLRGEMSAHRASLQKMRINIEMNKEKDTAKYRRDKKTLARMMTAIDTLTKKEPKQELKKVQKKSKVPAPSKRKK